MRILWLVYGDLGQPTGGYVYDRLVVEGLRASGDDVEVADPRRAQVAGGAGGGPGLAWDAVVGDGLCMPELGPVFESMGSGGAARVLLVHHLTSWELERGDPGPTRAAEARAIAASDRLVVTGEATAARLAGEHPGRAVDVVLPGADRLPRRARSPGPAGSIRLLFVGSLIARKRLPIVLDALEALADPAITLTLVGDAGREPGCAAAIAERIGRSPILSASVRRAGVLDDEGLAEAMAAADALVLASSLEGYGMALAEALHAGLPVLVSRQTAAAAGVAASGAALVFDDAGGLARALRRLASDPRLGDDLRRSARAVGLPRWSEASLAFRDVLTRAAAGRAAAPGPRR